MEDPSVQLNGCILMNNMEGLTMAKFLKVRSQDPNALFLRWIQVRSKRGSGENWTKQEGQGGWG